VVAVKKVTCGSKASFEREYNILRHLRKMKHANNHLVTLLAAYEQNHQFFLILPWAEFDLHHYWLEKFPDAPCGDESTSSWIQEQCCGLAGAVSTLHHYHTTSQTSMVEKQPAIRAEPRNRMDDTRSFLILNGRHGDIKPANILWYPTQHGLGILRLSDFGTAHFSRANCISPHEKDMMPSSRPYRSPESILPDGEISAQCDVWALGCVFLEFICWYAGGRQLLNRFEKARAWGCESASFCCLRDKRPDAPLHMELKESVQEVCDFRTLFDCILTVDAR
jgi:serine/threonine protein kinase